MATKKSTKKESRMISISLINITEVLEMLKNGESKAVISELERMHSAEARYMVLSEQETLQATSSLMRATANSESKLNDKVLGMFFPHAAQSLNRVGVIKI